MSGKRLQREMPAQAHADVQVNIASAQMSLALWLSGENWQWRNAAGDQTAHMPLKLGGRRNTVATTCCAAEAVPPKQATSRPTHRGHIEMDRVLIKSPVEDTSVVSLMGAIDAPSEAPCA